AGSQTVTATDTVTASITGSATVTVSGLAVVSQLLVTAPASATAGAPCTITVTAAHTFGNTVPSYPGTVNFTKSDSGTGSAVPADYTFVAADNGAHTSPHDAPPISAGSQTVTATDTVTASITGSATVTVSGLAVVSKLGVTAPATASAGVA